MWLVVGGFVGFCLLPSCVVFNCCCDAGWLVCWIVQIACRLSVCLGIMIRLLALGWLRPLAFLFCLDVVWVAYRRCWLLAVVGLGAGCLGLKVV